MKKAITLIRPRGWMSLIGRSVFLVLFAWGMTTGLNAQTVMDLDNDAGGVNPVTGAYDVCDHLGATLGAGVYTDDGGASLYSADIVVDASPDHGDDAGEEIFWTFCPSSQMDSRLRITFDQFDVATGDAFTVYGGPCGATAAGIGIAGASVGSQVLTGASGVDANGNAIAPGLRGGAGWVDATCNNLTGCITIGWNPNGDVNKGTGWTINVTEVARDAHLDDFTLFGGAKLSLSCLLYTSPSPRDRTRSRMPSSA